MQEAVVGPVPRADEAALGLRQRDRGVVADVGLVVLHRGGLQAPPVAGARVHLREDVVERAQEVAAVVGEHDLVVGRQPLPADEVAREEGERAEVVGAVRDAPGAPGDAGELVELAGLEHAVGEVEDVGVPGQLGEVGRRRSRR